MGVVFAADRRDSPEQTGCVVCLPGSSTTFSCTRWRTWWCPTIPRGSGSWYTSIHTPSERADSSPDTISERTPLLQPTTTRMTPAVTRCCIDQDTARGDRGHRKRRSHARHRDERACRCRGARGLQPRRRARLGICSPSRGATELWRPVSDACRSRDRYRAHLHAAVPARRAGSGSADCRASTSSSTSP